MGEFKLPIDAFKCEVQSRGSECWWVTEEYLLKRKNKWIAKIDPCPLFENLPNVVDYPCETADLAKHELPRLFFMVQEFISWNTHEGWKFSSFKEENHERILNRQTPPDGGLEFYKRKMNQLIDRFNRPVEYVGAIPFIFDPQEKAPCIPILEISAINKFIFKKQK